MGKKLHRIQYTLLAIILVIGVLLRLQNFSLLPIDGHPMRQTDTESVAYNLAFRSFNVLEPQNSLIRPQTNKDAYFFLEFPAYQSLIAFFYKVFGWHIEVAHLVNIGLYLIGAFSFFYFVKQYLKRFSIAFFAVVFFSFAPGSIFFIGHAIHPDVYATAMLLASFALYMFAKQKKHVIFIFLSLLTLSLSVATRPFIIIVMPAYLYLLLMTKAAYWEYPAYILASPAIYGLWRWWQTKYPMADHSWENWILFGKEQLRSFEVVFNHLVKKNIVGEVVGKSITLFAAMGTVLIVVIREKRMLFPLIWLLGVPVYVYFAPAGNIYHQYYANIYLTPILLLAAYGVGVLYEFLHKKNRNAAYFVAVIIILFTAYNGYRTSRYYFEDIIPVSHVKIAEEVNEQLPLDAKVVYLGTLNSIPFSLYHRKGWMVGAGPVDVDKNADAVISMKQYGAEYVVEGVDNTDLTDDELKKIQDRLPLFYESKWVRIYKIQ